MRGRISAAVRSLLLVLKSAHSLRLCAQWYAEELHQAFLAASSADTARGIFQVSSSSRQNGFPEPLKGMCGKGTSRVTEGKCNKHGDGVKLE